MPDEDHPWQADARTDYVRLAKQIAVVNACVGSGKTRLATSIARDLGCNVLIFSPFTTINRGWQETMRDYEIQIKNGYDQYWRQKGYKGFVVTYASLPFSAGIYRALVSRGNWLIIFDEGHHLGDSLTWGDAARYAFADLPDVRILFLTGTPWRTDGGRIPFVTYGEDDCVIGDINYPYRKGVRDKVVRAIEFPAMDGDARLATPDGYSTLRIQAATNDQIPDVIRSAIDGRSGWLLDTIRAAERKRQEHARILAPRGVSSAMIIFVSTQAHAESVSRLIQTRLGIKPVKIVSDDADSDDKLEKFKYSTDTCVIAVRKISEGVDIPRLTVGVFATNCKTRLFFNQANGRLVRRIIDRTKKRDEEGYYLDEGIVACMFIPAATPHVTFAKEIDEEVKEVLRAEEEESSLKNSAFDGDRSGPGPVLPALNGELAAVLYSGQEYDPPLLDLSAGVASDLGVVDKFAIYRALETRGVQAPLRVSVGTATAILEDEEENLRREVQVLASRLDRQLGEEFGYTNGQLLRKGFPPRDRANLRQLNAMRDYLLKRLS